MKVFEIPETTRVFHWRSKKKSFVNSQGVAVQSSRYSYFCSLN
jgi:hypothetical protein